MKKTIKVFCMMLMLILLTVACSYKDNNIKNIQNKNNIKNGGGYF